MFKKIFSKTRELIQVTNYLKGGSMGKKEIIASLFIFPLLHIGMWIIISPQTKEEQEAYRLLSATIQWAVIILGSCIIGLNASRWQLDEGYAGDLLTYTTPKTWLWGNMLAAWGAGILQITSHTLTMWTETKIHMDINPIPNLNWAMYLTNGVLCIGTIIAAATSFGLITKKSLASIFIVIILLSWLNYIPDPISYLLPPIYILDAKGLLTAAGSTASYRANPGPLIATNMAALLYIIAIMMIHTNKSIIKKLKT